MGFGLVGYRNYASRTGGWAYRRDLASSRPFGSFPLRSRPPFPRQRERRDGTFTPTRSARKLRRIEPCVHPAASGREPACALVPAAVNIGP